MIVVLDTNILVSGLLFGGEPRQLVDAALDGRFLLVTSPHQLDELRRVLGHRKLARFVTDPDDLVGLIAEVAEVIDPAVDVQLSRDPDDDRILEIAVAASADLLVSGDNDLLSIDLIDDFAIVGAKEAAALLEAI